MPDPFTDVRLDVDPARGTDPTARPLESRGFRIGIVGDFSARDGRPSAGRAGSREIRVDRDNLDEVIAHFAPALTLPLEPLDQRVHLSFERLEDFHPDAIHDRLALFREVRALRARAADAATLPSVLSELGLGDATQPAGFAPTPPAPDPAGGSVLDRVVDATTPVLQGRQEPLPLEESDFRTFVRRVVAPHLVAHPDPRQAEVLGLLDVTMSRMMREILHHPLLQAVESLWRAVDRLVRSVETSTELSVHLIDATYLELAEAMAAEPSADPLKGLLERGPGAGDEPWTILVGAYTFTPRAIDLSLLLELGRSGARAGAPWICAASPALVGARDATSLNDAPGGSEPPPVWSALRRDPAARWVGLTLPRLLGRLPYGEATDSCERFRFEESDGEMKHEAYLWTNPAIAAAELLARSFARDGWGMRPGSHREVGGLPLHVVGSGADSSLLPCAEVWLTERAADRMMEAGLMPFASRRDRDAAQLVRFQSIAHPPQPLPGAWSAAP